MNIEELEKLRKKARNTYIIGALVIIIISIIMFSTFKHIAAIFIPAIFGIAILAFFGGKPKDEFTKAYKQVFVLKALSSVFTDLVYEPNRGIASSTISETGMMNMGDRFSSNDFISGKYKNINVMLSDVHIEEEHETTDSDGNTSRYWVTIFLGRWMIFDFNKTFKANVQVCEKGFGNSKLGNFFSDSPYKKVEMEDTDFNKTFKTYAQDEHEAFYILTPHLMEKIKKLNDMIKGKILFCFVDNKLHVGLYNNKDSFEHSVFSKKNEELVIKDISSDIKMITDFVDELSLDNDLFTVKSNI